MILLGVGRNERLTTRQELVVRQERALELDWVGPALQRLIVCYNRKALLGAEGP